MFIKVAVYILITLASIGSQARHDTQAVVPDTTPQSSQSSQTRLPANTSLEQAEAEIAHTSEWSSTKRRVGCNLNTLTKAQCELLPVYEIPTPRNLTKNIALLAGSTRRDLPEYTVSDLSDSNKIAYEECKNRWRSSPGNTAERKIIANENYCVISTRVTAERNGITGIEYSYSYIKQIDGWYFQVTFSNIYYGSEEHQVEEGRLKALFEKIVSGLKITKKSQL